ALDRGQSLPLPSPFAAAQGGLAALAMSLAKEVGDANVRVNVVALGLLDMGLSKTVSPALVEDFKTHSALRRLGTTREAALAITWLALENTFMSGRVVPVNGGI